MERRQNIKEASSRRVGANFDFNGNPITQNDAGGVIRFSGVPRFYGCGHQSIPGVNICTCQL
jgi:hypothetical protein